MDPEVLAEDKIQCRILLKSLLDNKLKQHQIKFLIYLLSLELENIEQMKKLAGFLREVFQDECFLSKQDES